MSRHDDTPPMKRVLPPAKRVIPTNHPAYRNYEARILAKAEKDITTQQPPRLACKTTIADIFGSDPQAVARTQRAALGTMVDPIDWDSLLSEG